MKLQPRHWSKFQHYKDRCPPWIKLHRDVLNDREFMSLPIASKALAPLLWLLASESKDGVFNASADELMFRLRVEESELNSGLKPLIDKGFFVVASGMLAECLQDAIPETERETDKETKKKASKVAPPEGVSHSVWESFLQVRKAKKAPITEVALAGIMREAQKAGWTLEQALAECCTRGWQAFKADWVAPIPSKADVARITVPGSTERDPALVKIEQDHANKTAPSPEVMQKIRSLIKVAK